MCREIYDEEFEEILSQSQGQSEEFDSCNSSIKRDCGMSSRYEMENPSLAPENSHDNSELEAL